MFIGGNVDWEDPKKVVEDKGGSQVRAIAEVVSAIRVLGQPVTVQARFQDDNNGDNNGDNNDIINNINSKNSYDKNNDEKNNNNNDDDNNKNNNNKNN